MIRQENYAFEITLDNSLKLNRKYTTKIKTNLFQGGEKVSPYSIPMGQISMAATCPGYGTVSGTISTSATPSGEKVNRLCGITGAIFGSYRLFG